MMRMMYPFVATIETGYGSQFTSLTIMDVQEFVTKMRELLQEVERENGPAWDDKTIRIIVT